MQIGDQVLFKGYIGNPRRLRTRPRTRRRLRRGDDRRRYRPQGPKSPRAAPQNHQRVGLRGRGDDAGQQNAAGRPAAGCPQNSQDDGGRKHQGFRRPARSRRLYVCDRRAPDEHAALLYRRAQCPQRTLRGVGPFWPVSDRQLSGPYAGPALPSDGGRSQAVAVGRMAAGSVARPQPPPALRQPVFRVRPPAPHGQRRRLDQTRLAAGLDATVHAALRKGGRRFI